VIATIIGNVLHVLYKILSLSKDHKVANIEFSLIGYLKDDKWALLVDLVSSFALVFIAEEWLDFDSRIAGKIKSIFVFVGFTGSFVIIELMSVATAKLRKAVDYKTNIADKETGTLNNPTPK
jgi:hypothetical protein